MDFLRDNNVDVDSAIEILGDMEMYNETLDDFISEMEDRLPNIDQYKNDEDMENYAILVHSLKSDSKYLGFTKLADLAYDHQVKAEANDVNYINGHYDELMDEVNRIMKLIDKYKNM